MNASPSAPRDAAPAPAAAAPPSESSSAWIRQASDLVSDLQRRSPLIYWSDFLLSVTGAWLLAFAFFRAPGFPAYGLLALLGSALLFYRAGTFIHEIIHFRAGELPWFGRVWNLLLGIPMLGPWIFYRNHIDHHSVRYFGTPDDGEYLPLAAAPPVETFKYLLQAPLLPVLALLRFGVAGPLSWLHSGFREWILTAASAGVTNPYYRKRFPAADQRHLLIVEVLCFLWLVLLAVLLATGVIGAMVLFKGFLVLTVALTINWVRNMAAHHYGNRGERMTITEQVADSINVTGQTWLTMLMFPVGLRYHALHHLFPYLPYHNLGEAHRRLMERLPADAPYRRVNCESFFAAAATLWRGARSTRPQDSAVTLWRNWNARA